MKKVLCGAYVTPTTFKSQVCAEGCFCASEPVDSVTVKVEVDEYINIDNGTITFD